MARPPGPDADWTAARAAAGQARSCPRAQQIKRAQGTRLSAQKIRRVSQLRQERAREARDSPLHVSSLGPEKLWSGSACFSTELADGKASSAHRCSHYPPLYPFAPYNKVTPGTTERWEEGKAGPLAGRRWLSLAFSPTWPQDWELRSGDRPNLTLTSYPAAGWRLIPRVRPLSK